MTWQKVQKTREEIDAIVRETKDYFVKSKDISPEFWQKPLVEILEKAIDSGLSEMEEETVCNLVDNTNEELLQRFEAVKNMPFTTNEDDYTVIDTHVEETGLSPSSSTEQKPLQVLPQSSVPVDKSLVASTEPIQPKPGDVDLRPGAAPPSSPKYDESLVQQALLKKPGRMAKLAKTE